MSTTDLSLRFSAAQTIVRELGALALGYFSDRTKLGISMKGAQDWLTVADGMVEAEFRRKIAELFPDDGVMGEEMGGGDSDRLWIIDPIDGTANFAHGDRQWCISVGFLLNGVPELGIVYAPAQDEMYLGRKGHGASMNGVAINASDTLDVARSTIEIGWSNRRPLDEYLTMVRDTFTAGANVKRGASGALGLTHCALGRTDGYAESHINSWDVAAGVVIAQEAGCVINDFFAKPDALTKGNYIQCVAPGIATALSKILKLGH